MAFRKNILPYGRHFAVLDAPSNLGLKPPAPGEEPGVKYMATTLRRHGLLRYLGAEDAGEVIPSQYEASIEAATRVRNAHAIRAYSIQLAGSIQELLAQKLFPIVLGGDCSILLGAALALSRLGHRGLFFIDGHSDLLTPESSQSGGAAGMDLALVTGTGPSLLSNIEGRRPYIRPDDVVLFGYRWPAEGATSPAAPPKSMLAFPLERIRDQGVTLSSREAIAHLEKIELAFWLHVDLDVLAPTWMPAVDSPDPGGLNPEELVAILRTVLNSRWCMGVDVTIYDPTRDENGEGADLIVELLSRSLGHARLDPEL